MGLTIYHGIRRMRWNITSLLTLGTNHATNCMLVKYDWNFQVRLSNTKVVSWLFGRIVNTMPIVTVDRSMHCCPMPCGLGQ